MEWHRISPSAALWGLMCLCSLFVQSSAEGCFWTGQCLNRWIGGGCGTGHAVVDYSPDCGGLCPQPQYEACLPLYTHYQCCQEEFALESDVCGRCSSKLEFGDHWVCCSDCSQPTITQKETIAGYCRTGAQLSVQSILPEVVTWMTGDWSSCSCSGSHAIRRRDVFCVGTSDTHQYSVEDSRCAQQAKPQELEACSNSACGAKSSRQHKGMPVWATLLICLISLVAVAGLAFVGYILYKRHYGSDQNHGFVYVMLEGYS